MKILIAAGGTGGHLFPALAVVSKLEEITNNNIEFHFFGRADKIEGRIVPQLGYKLHTAKINGLTKLLSFNTIKLPFQIVYYILKLKRLIKKESIDAVLCTGAYLSYPAGIAASMCNKKLFLMESNVNPGKAISMLVSKASIIYTTFDETEKYFSAQIKYKLKNYGNPIRQEIINNSQANIEKSEQNKFYELFGLDKEKPVLLVFGGSLGAKAINDAVLK
jgi:UDP-N-acetylglucosamine--N-acetylmuramyl-(pentapeptide) pyrophosphoryl-undecaprenol N-acetylglucosamine transferase